MAEPRQFENMFSVCFHAYSVFVWAVKANGPNPLFFFFFIIVFFLVRIQKLCKKTPVMVLELLRPLSN